MCFLKAPALQLEYTSLCMTHTTVVFIYNILILLREAYCCWVHGVEGDPLILTIVVHFRLLPLHGQVAFTAQVWRSSFKLCFLAFGRPVLCYSIQNKASFLITSVGYRICDKEVNTPRRTNGKERV